MSRKATGRTHAHESSQSPLQQLASKPEWEWPQNARDLLLHTLCDGHSKDQDRILAARLAGSVTFIDDDLTDALLANVRDSSASEELRAQTAISLGPLLEEGDTYGFDDPDDVPVSQEKLELVQRTLRELYEDKSLPRLVRRRSLEASVRAPSDWHAASVRAAWSSGDADWRLTAAFCMRWVPGFESEILSALEDKDEDVRFEAICAAGNWEIAAAWAKIAPLVDPSTAKPLLLAAIEAVTAIRPTEGARLVSDLADSDDEEIAETVSEALAMAGEGEDEVK